jgi:hypothetical protein
MRVPALAVLAIGSLAATAPAHAQAFSPNFPVCLQVYGPDAYKECRYSSIEQCNSSAAGRPAQCMVNPYFVSAAAPVSRHRRTY